ncbi:hypothetical protein TNIN_327111 [Trichonephila inaurata madagascariensis]|uniref:Uncharacterized protein n=1 Tax=Trichonephila inaurata madagascariensis TaxID=2747483 RepID=A0A8X6XED1_9ARAC|nr:hypothetical protein TNIN_327111 [Trichonephila inaurata madagascariensis]
MLTIQEQVPETGAHSGTKGNKRREKTGKKRDQTKHEQSEGDGTGASFSSCETRVVQGRRIGTHRKHANRHTHTRRSEERGDRLHCTAEVFGLSEDEGNRGIGLLCAGRAAHFGPIQKHVTTPEWDWRCNRFFFPSLPCHSREVRRQLGC